MTYTHLTDAIPCNTHRGYRLTCQQYEGLLAESGGRCQICGFPAEQMPQGKLYIDHGGAPGRWPVRGLLCIRCNSRLEGGIPFDAVSAAYLHNAWYLRQCAAQGVPVTGGPEPEGLEVFEVFTERRWRKRWGYWRTDDSRVRSRDWQRMNRDFGPFNLIPIGTRRGLSPEEEPPSDNAYDLRRGTATCPGCVTPTTTPSGPSGTASPTRRAGITAR